MHVDYSMNGADMGTIMTCTLHSYKYFALDYPDVSLTINLLSYRSQKNGSQGETNLFPFFRVSFFFQHCLKKLIITFVQGSKSCSFSKLEV